MRQLVVLALFAAVAWGCGSDAHAPLDAAPDAAVDAAPDAAPDAASCANVTCGPRQTCVAGACTCNTDAACPGGAGTTCTTDAANGNAPATLTCLTDSDGCVFAAPLVDCGVHQSCGNGACTCNTDAACPSGTGTFCTAGDASFETCSTDPQGCVYDAGSTACTGVTSCTDPGAGSAQCTCPPAGSAPGDGCANAGDTTCAAGDVLTCVAMGTCNVWVDTAACSGAGLACVSGGGGATCQCPAVTGSTFIADPNATPIVLGGMTVPATGVASPTGCRFASLGAAIATAQAFTLSASAPATVLVESATTGTFSTETWPLVVPDQVTVTSDDSALTPSRYTLSPGSGDAAAIVEGGATFGRLAIFAQLPDVNGPAAVTLAGCTAAAPSVTVGPLAIQFASGANGDGILLADPGASGQACSAFIGSATIRGAYDGIAISTAAGATPTTATATISGATIANSVHDGLVVFQTATAGVDVNSSTITGSGSTNVFLDTATLAAHHGALTVIGSTIDNTVSGADGIAVQNDASGQTASGAVLSLAGDTVTGHPGAGDDIRLVRGTANLTAVVAESAGDRGIYAFGSALTMADDSGGGHCFVEGAAGSSAIDLDAGTTLTATNVRALSNAGVGVAIANTANGGTGGATTVTLDSCDIESNTGGGITIASASARPSTLVVEHGTVANNRATGIFVGDHATVQLYGALAVDGNSGPGLRLVDATANVSGDVLSGAAPAFQNNTGPGVLESAGFVSLDGRAASPVTVASNGSDGIDVVGGTFAGTEVAMTGNRFFGVFASPTTGTFSLSSSSVSNNLGGGIAILDRNASNNAVDVTSSTITNNGGSGFYGIIIQGSAIPPNGSSTVLSGVQVSGNGIGIGIGAATSNPVSVEIDSAQVENNTQVGVLYASQATTNALALHGLYVAGNGSITIGTGAIGGIAFEGVQPASLVLASSTIGANDGNQIGAYIGSVVPGVSYAYDLSGGNVVVNCTPASGYYAVRGEAVSPSQLSIDADNIQWADTTFPGTNVNTAGTVTVSTANATGGATCPTH